MAINETLKFSWGHIIAFVALIFISYVSFMGITYLSDGNFLLAGLGVVAIDAFLIIFFIVPQILKGTDRKFGKKIRYERALMFASPVVFIIVMMPYVHFWSVYEKRARIEVTFSESIASVKGVFDSYERYAGKRIDNYERTLSENDSVKISRENKVEALRLQLVDDNYVSLKNTACGWIDNARGATVWNVFMIGNIREIVKALNEWGRSLSRFSSKRMADEDDGVNSFSTADECLVEAGNNLKNLRYLYLSTSLPSMIALMTGVALYILLLFPYIVQRRNTKSLYRLIGMEGDTSFSDIGSSGEGDTDKQDGKTDFNGGDGYGKSSNGDYDSFTM